MPFSAPPAHVCEHSARGKFPMEGDRISQSEGRTDSTFREQVGVFSKTCSTAANPAELREYKKDGSAYGS